MIITHLLLRMLINVYTSPLVKSVASVATNITHGTFHNSYSCRCRWYHVFPEPEPLLPVSCQPLPHLRVARLSLLGLRYLGKLALLSSQHLRCPHSFSVFFFFLIVPGLFQHKSKISMHPKKAYGLFAVDSTASWYIQ